MGEITDMMLDGTFCGTCGVVMDDIVLGCPPPGHLRYCSIECEPPGYHQAMERERIKKEHCPICGAKRRNVEAHMKEKHGK